MLWKPSSYNRRPILNNSQHVSHHNNDVSADTIAAINGFEAPSGFQEEGSREQSFLYSLGNYIKPIGVEEGGQYTGKFFCQVTKACRSANKIVPCKQGKRSNVNKHMLNKHSLRGQKGEDMCSTRKGKAGTIQAALGASKTFAVGTKRCVQHVCVMCMCTRAGCNLGFGVVKTAVMMRPKFKILMLNFGETRCLLVVVSL